MALIYHGTEVDDVYYHGTKLDYVYYHGVMVYEATIYVAKPTLSGAFTFDNTAKAPTISGFDANAMVQTGTASATSAGTYTITWTLNEGYAWADGTTDPYSLTWSIAKRAVTIPSLTNTSYTWAVNSTFAPTVNNVNASYVNQSGTTSSTNAGSWTVTWSLKHSSDTTWSDGTTANKTGSWSVAKRSMTIPSISSAKSFSFIEGTTRSVTVANFNSTYETQSGTTSTSALGTYTLTWALRYPANTQWSGGTTTNKTASWSIVWTNGTSHYNADIYNRGWNSGKLTFKDTYDTRTGALNMNSDHFEMSGKMFRLTEEYAGKTFHVVLAMAVRTGTPTIPATVRLLEFRTDWGYYGANKPNTDEDAEYTVGTSYMQLDGKHSNSNVRYFGVRNGSSVGNANTFWYRIQRIWIT